MFSNGAWAKPHTLLPNQTHCEYIQATSPQRCVKLQWGFSQSAYDRNKGVAMYPSWHGSLVESKRDASGLEYKRNRVYDPATGRFTQEDPIGLAGGLNAYGFAKGDPINLSDPYGLNPIAACAIPVVAPGCVAVAVGILDAVIFVSSAAGAGYLVGKWFQRRRAQDLPARGIPNSTAVKDDGKGRGQIRDYDAEGRPKTDFDFGHDHTGAGDPHAHDWDWSKTPPRQPPRPIRPKETPPTKTAPDKAAKP